ncbi:FHA domain containing protein [Tritrichomonas foetus]|uniref:E3 ubiquitin-protein ligase CHFR n=1 Tax=Tritrichomonas foetus TaxID=1144522 RepID=A0A1J4KML1_9EUKA|nr:FHA domain containing protein [Tritrichomonas foetus]|eukprot:OHT11036.1 FHA domain containing protein [Tritrichomonas foetus]
MSEMSTAILLRLSQQKIENAPQFVLLDKERVQIGRRSEVRMDTSRHQEISKKHATIFRKSHSFGDSWTIIDSNSLNGTFVNGRKIERSLLANGSEIVFGGGPEFLTGDLLVNYQDAECRYLFLIVPPQIKFVEQLDIYDTETEENHPCCSICFEQLTRFHMLPCRHCFCASCLNQWINTCYENWQPCTCPLCRKVFTQSQVLKDDAVVSQNEIFVFTLLPLLDICGFEKRDEIINMSVFTEWSDDKRETFWNAFSKVRKSFTYRIIFLHLTNMTVAKLFEASINELMIAANNFELKITPPTSNNSYNYNNNINNRHSNISNSEIHQKCLEEQQRNEILYRLLKFLFLNLSHQAGTNKLRDYKVTESSVFGTSK